VLGAFASQPLGAQTPTPTPAAKPGVITPPDGGTIITTTPTPLPRTPGSLDGGTIITATPTPLPKTPGSLDGGTIITATPTPLPLPTGVAEAVAHERRLVREVQQSSDNIKFKGDFGAQLWLITNGNFFEDWRKPETPPINPVSIALRDQPIYTPIIFYGEARDAKGLCNVSYDITVRRPDQSVYSQSTGLVGFQNLGPADDRVLQLGNSYATITMRAGDPAGLYTVEAVVHDNIGRVDLSLVQHFILQAP
jgi:hypothetical protein